MRTSSRLCVNTAQAFLTDTNDSISIFTNVIPTEGLDFWISAIKDFPASALRPLKYI